MDDGDVLLRIKNSFYLGNYKSAFEVWRETAKSGMTMASKTEEQVNSLVQRLLVIYIRNNEKVALSDQDDH